METNTILLICAALFPAAALCIYIFNKDRIEKEPIGLLIRLLLVGCAVVIPVLLVNPLFEILGQLIFAPLAVEQGGQMVLEGGTNLAYLGYRAFIQVALLEEGFKFLAMLWLTKRNKNFNSLFDGIVYAVFVSLGFAALENILYVVENGWVVAAMRAVLSVPGHMFFAVQMGYYYSFWHMYEKAKEREQTLKNAGILTSNLPAFSGKSFLIRGLIMAVLAHGMYDFCCFVDTGWATLMFYAFIIFLYIYCFGQIKKMSKQDESDKEYSMAMLLKKYPELADKMDQIQMIEVQGVDQMIEVQGVD